MVALTRYGETVIATREYVPERLGSYWGYMPLAQARSHALQEVTELALSLVRAKADAEHS